MPSLSHLPSCTSSKSNLYLVNSLAAAVNEPALHRLLTFHVPNLMSLLHGLGRTKVSVQVRSFLCDRFVTRYVVSNSPNPQARGPPLVGYTRLLVQYIRSYAPYQTPLLHPQPDNAPCRGDRDPLIKDTHSILSTDSCERSPVTAHYYVLLISVYFNSYIYQIFIYFRISAF